MQSTVEMLARLVSFKTVSRDSNAALIAEAARHLAAAGGRVRVLPGDQPGKSNLLASFGPAGDHGLILSGHSDVVPVDGQDWASDPFTLTQRQDRLRARGAVDMKGFIASALTAAASLDETTLARPLHIALSHDEETGCIGVRSMLDLLAREGFRAAGCIIGEPTGLDVVVGHKGKVAGCITCQGEAAHSANPELGCNAIYLAAGMVAEIRALQEWLRAHGAADAAYAVPYSTLHVGTIAGGQVLNIVPELCQLRFEIRFLPGDEPAALLARLGQAGAALAAAEQARGRHAAVAIDIDNSYPGLATAAETPLIVLAQSAGAGATAKVGFGTEAGLFEQKLGLPVVVCGPGSIDRAHKPDEFITQDELDACDAFLAGVIATLQ